KDHGVTPNIAAVSDAETAERWLGEMQALNEGRHADNAWDDASFRAFARALVLRGLVTGEVELLRICAGEHLLGYLLNFLYAGRAMNYQSAFAAPISGKAKPGLMCHAAAVTRYADAGLTLYSLLAGKDRYKQSLATGQETLEWWTLERFSLRLEAEALLRKVLKRPASA
ncbi:MAG: GNAT family N-acetyltransferase, partial [Sphingobium sp.]